MDTALAEQLGAKARGPPRLKRSQTTTVILEHPTATDAVERLSSVGASSARGRLGLLPRRRETPAHLARQPSALKSVTEQRRKSTDKGDATTEGDHDDGSSLYFAIETRLELKERLVVVQKQLDGVLMRAKLAWMRCFSSPPSSEQQQLPSPSRSASDDCSHDTMAWAGELVKRVEALAADLTVAFDRATSTDSNNSLDEYKTLVLRAEQQLASLLALADRIASMHPDCFRRQERSVATDPEEDREAAKVTGSPTRSAMEGVAYPSAPVAFDLPSMKKYCARVAPPYAAYLPSKQDKHRGR
jgi:hypothetical protein